MCAMLNVLGRPVTLSRYVVTLIEQRVESFKHKRFILLFHRLIHVSSFVPERMCHAFESYRAGQLGRISTFDIDDTTRRSRGSTALRKPSTSSNVGGASFFLPEFCCPP